MHRIDVATAAPALPAPAVAGTPGFFTEAVPPMMTPATVVSADWANAVQEELSHAIEEQGFTLDKGDRFQLSKAMQRLSGGGLNVIINPEGAIKQRGGSTAITSSEAIAVGGRDHWWAKAGGAGDIGAITGGSSSGADMIGAPSRASAKIRLQKTTNASTGVNPTLRQSIEGVHAFAGQLVVLAFDAIKFSGADLPVVGAEVEQRFGTVASPSATVTTPLTLIGASTIDGSWRRFIFTGTLPAITGKTLTLGNHLKVRVKFGANQTFDVFLTGFVFARGGQDPGYIPRGLSTELLLCQRYFESNFPNSNAEGMAVGLWDTSFSLSAGDVETLKRRFIVGKYVTTAGLVVTWYAHDESANFITEGASTKHAVTAQFADPEKGTGYPRITSPPATGTLRFFRAFWKADAEIPD